MSGFWITFPSPSWSISRDKLHCLPQSTELHQGSTHHQRCDLSNADHHLTCFIVRVWVSKSLKEIEITSVFSVEKNNICDKIWTSNVMFAHVRFMRVLWAHVNERCLCHSTTIKSTPLEHPCRYQAYKRCWLWFTATLSNPNKLLFQQQTVSELLKSLKCCIKGSATVVPTAFSILFKQKYILICLLTFIYCQHLCSSCKPVKQTWVSFCKVYFCPSLYPHSELFSFYRFQGKPQWVLTVLSCTVHLSTSKYLCEMPANLGQSYGLNCILIFNCCCRG